MITPLVERTKKTMASSNSIHIHAPAKVNLTLNITGKRDDGYHLLHSLACFSDFGDDITLNSHNEFKFTVGSEIGDVPINDDNLVVKTAHLLANHYNKPLNCHIHLTKRIPMGAGLGGGSTDAAATATALLQFWGIVADEKEINTLLLTLGADIPVCYHAKPCIFEGIGEIITPVHDMPDLHAALVYPNTPSSTPEIFKNFDQNFSKTPVLDENNYLDFIKNNDNELTIAAIKVTPVIKEILNETLQTADCLLSKMSGSGSCCFSLYPSKQASQLAVEKIQKERPNWWVRPVILKGSE